MKRPENKLTRRRRLGSTLGLVAICVLVIAVIGIATYFLAKILGGGLELANATDSGALNVAKNAIRNPSKDAVTDFPSNPDVATNFALLGDNGTKLDLLVYNRLVAQSTLVALNARDEDTTDAADAAKKVWTALNDVGKALSKDLDSSQYMGTFFNRLAQSNNVRMSGNNTINLSDYKTGFLRRGDSANVWINPVVLATVGGGNIVPQNTAGQKAPSGSSYLAGYVPYTIQCGAYNLEFSAVTVCPNDKPHLVSYGDFLLNNKDDFVTGKGNPAYPQQTLPPNAYTSSGDTKDGKTNLLVGAVACAIASSMNVQFQMQIPYGYLEVINGASEKPGNMQCATTSKDVFSNYPGLAGPGLAVSNNKRYFCPDLHGGIDSDIAKELKLKINLQDPMKPVRTDQSIQSELQAFAMSHGYTQQQYNSTTKSYDTVVDQGAVDKAMGLLNTLLSGGQYGGLNIINVWVYINNLDSQLLKDWLWDKDVPTKEGSVEVIRRGNGDMLASYDELRTLRDPEYALKNCQWFKDYSKSPTQDPCMEMLGAFRKGYGLYTGTSPAADPSGTGYTALELLKAEVMNNRINCSNATAVDAAAILPSGVKLFQHGKSYPAPGVYPYNFGTVSTPWEYLVMIDQVTPGKCGEGNVTNVLLKRCQQIEPALTRNDLQSALSSLPLPLGATYYLYCDKGRKLTMSTQKPVTYVPGTLLDGTKSAQAVACGKPYDVMGTLVNTSTGKGSKSAADSPPFNQADTGTDGMFPGWAWHDPEATTCLDTATFTPSSGYNNLLGSLTFANACQGTSGLSRPN